MVDLNQFFDRMECHMERQSELTTTENTENPILVVLKEMRSYSDVYFPGAGDPAIAERWLSTMEFWFRYLG